MLNSCYIVPSCCYRPGFSIDKYLKTKGQQIHQKLVEEGDLILFDTEVMTWNCVRGGDDHVWLTQFDDNWSQQ